MRVTSVTPAPAAPWSSQSVTQGYLLLRGEHPFTVEKTGRRSLTM